MSSFIYHPPVKNVMGELRTQCEKCGALKPAKYRLCWDCLAKQKVNKPSNADPKKD